MKGIFGVFSSFFVLALLLAPADASSFSTIYDMNIFLNRPHPFDTGPIQQQNVMVDAPPTRAGGASTIYDMNIFLNRPHPFDTGPIQQQNVIVGGTSTITQDDLPGSFTADEINVDHVLGVIAASGNVKAVYEQWTLTADLIRFNQQTNVLTAWGNVSLQEPGHDVVFADFMVLSDDLKNAILEAIHIAANGGRPDTEAIVPDIEARTARDTFIAPLKNKNPFYVSVGSGIVRVIEFDSSFFFQYNDSKLNTQSRTFHDGWAGSLRIGYRLNDHLRGELEYTYSKVALRSLHDFARPAPDFIVPNAPGTLKQNTIMINGYWDISEYAVGAYALTPYIGGGLGATRVSYRQGVFIVPGTSVTYTPAEVDEWALTSQLRAGLRFKVTPAISISQEYTYRNVAETTLENLMRDPGVGQFGDVDAYGTHQLMLLLEYHFGQ